ncbi:MAG: histidine kinase, partial [Bacteroidota bacterium]
MIPFYVNGQQNVFQKYTSTSSFLDNHFHAFAITEDKDGFLWMASRFNIYRFDGYEFTDLSKHRFDKGAFSAKQIGSRIIPLEGNKFAVQNGVGILDVIDFDENSIESFPLFPGKLSQASNKSIRFVFQDEHQILWVGAANGLRKVNLETKEIKLFTPFVDNPTPSSWPNDHNIVFSIIAHPLDKKQLIVGTQKGTFFFDKSENKFVKKLKGDAGVLSLFNPKLDEYVYAMDWEDGLVKFDLKDNSKIILNGPQGENLRSIYPMNDSIFITRAEGKIFGTINLNTELFAPFKDDVLRNLSTYRVRKDGFIDQYNRAYISNDTQIVKFHPFDLDSTKRPMLKVVTLMGEEFSKNIFSDEVFTLPEDEHNITLKYAAINPLVPESVQYTYKLDNGPWIKAGSSRLASFNNLSHGAHQLFLRAQDDGSFGKLEAEAFTFIVNRSFQNRPIFYWLLGLAILGSLSIAAWLFINRIKTQQKLQAAISEKTELELIALRSQMNPHFMFNSLNSIKDFILQNDKYRASEYLSDFAHLIRKILQYAKEDSIPLSEEIETLKLYVDLEQLRFENGFEFHCNIDS